jgi:SAM-dependent methyltransferase
MVLKHLGTMPSTDPSDLLRLRDSIFASDLFITVVGHLNFFTWLGKNPAGMKKICSIFQINERPADVMITLFKSLNLLEERDNCYHLTELTQEFLTDSSEWYLGPYISSLKERPICLDMLNVLKTGKPSSWGAKKDEKEWSLAMENEDFAEAFTAGMDSRGAYLASALAANVDLSNYYFLLDIAGASGIYASSIATRYSHISATVFEKPPVDKIAERSINNRGMSDRINVISGDMFTDEFPKGFDVHLFSNVLHDWNFIDVKKLIDNSYRNLNSGGTIIIHDAHLNEDKTGPLPVAEYSVLLMFSTEGKCYSISEIKKILEEAGFLEIRYIPTVANRSVLMGKKHEEKNPH